MASGMRVKATAAERRGGRDRHSGVKARRGRPPGSSTQRPKTKTYSFYAHDALASAVQRFVHDHNASTSAVTCELWSTYLSRQLDENSEPYYVIPTDVMDLPHRRARSGLSYADMKPIEVRRLEQAYQEGRAAQRRLERTSQGLSPDDDDDEDDVRVTPKRVDKPLKAKKKVKAVRADARTPMSITMDGSYTDEELGLSPVSVPSTRKKKKVKRNNDEQRVGRVDRVEHLPPPAGKSGKKKKPKSPTPPAVKSVPESRTRQRSVVVNQQVRGNMNADPRPRPRPQPPQEEDRDTELSPVIKDLIQRKKAHERMLEAKRNGVYDPNMNYATMDKY